MAQSTHPYKRSVSGSVGAGIKSVFGNGGKRFYTLVHKVSSKYHLAGESQQIIVDQIEIGRDPKCQVRFDESFSTVSRRHAAIVKDGDNWKLVQLSRTNSTYLNGHKVLNEWYLQNGDEIQLSTNGPKLGFIIPEGKKGTVGSIGLTARLNLFRKQALRPYKTAIWMMVAALLLFVGVGVWGFHNMDNDLKQKSRQIAELIDQCADDSQRADSLSALLTENNAKLKDYEKKMESMAKKLTKAYKELEGKMDNIQVGAGNAVRGLDVCINDTYYCVYVIGVGDDPKATVYASSGSAFLLNDGRLVTAQHVINPFFAIPENDNRALINGLLNQTPDTFTCYFYAYSPSGDRIAFKYPFSDSPFHAGDYSLTTIGTINYEGVDLPVKVSATYDNRDYAWVKTDRKGSLSYDYELSVSMPPKTHLDILGFPMGVGAEDLNELSPIYSESYVAREGLDVDGCILLSNSDTDHGNSGGPVLAIKNGEYVVVGILAGANRLGSKTNSEAAGKWKDRVVPIAVIK